MRSANCPSDVPGAKTTIEDVKDGVAVLVTASDGAAVEQVRERAARLGEIHARGAPRGGALGLRNCPVSMHGAMFTVTDIKAGVRMEMQPKFPAGLERFRSKLRKRVASRDALPKGARNASEGP